MTIETHFDFGRTTEPLLVEPIGFQLRGLPPFERVRITASVRDRLDNVYTSWGEYEADSSGAVRPGAQPALAGTYLGVDPFGLWWSMTPMSTTSFAAPPTVLATRLLAEVDGEALAQATLNRRCVALGVTRCDVRQDDLIATLFLPADNRPAPGVVVLGGSEGGLHAETFAALLASQGFATLAPAYFGMVGLPQRLVRIPVEYLTSSLSWLGRHDMVEARSLGLVGRSRGAELALLVAANSPELEAVVVYAPSGVMWGGFGGPDSPSGPAWTVGGRDQPYLRPNADVLNRALAHSPISLTEVFTDALDDGEAAARAAIPVDRIRCPVLLVSGDDDHLWPSTRMADMVVRQLGANGPGSRNLHVVCRGAGHSVGQPPGLPAAGNLATNTVDGRTYDLGGTRLANAASAARAWPELLSFLNKHLPNRDSRHTESDDGCRGAS